MVRWLRNRLIGLDHAPARLGEVGVSMAAWALPKRRQVGPNSRAAIGSAQWRFAECPPWSKVDVSSRRTLAPPSRTARDTERSRRVPRPHRARAWHSAG